MKKKQEARTLRRSTKDRVATGLIGGIASYFHIDPVITRLAYVVITAFTGFVPGIAAYVIGSLVVPSEE